MNFNCFKAYDIRGRVPDELNEDVAYRIGRHLPQRDTESAPAGKPRSHDYRNQGTQGGYRHCLGW